MGNGKADKSAQVVADADHAASSPPAREHRRNLPFLAATVDSETLRRAMDWVAKAPPGGRRSIGQWIDRLVERAGARDRARLAAARIVREKTAVELRSILIATERLRLGCDPRERIESLGSIRSAVQRIEAIVISIEA